MNMAVYLQELDLQGRMLRFLKTVNLSLTSLLKCFETLQLVSERPSFKDETYICYGQCGKSVNVCKKEIKSMVRYNCVKGGSGGRSPPVIH